MQPCSYHNNSCLQTTVLFLIKAPAKNISNARGCLVLERKQLRIGLKLKGRLHWGGPLICVIRTCKACSIGAHYDVHLLLRHRIGLASWPTSSLRCKISPARSMFGTGGVSTEGFLFLSRPTGSFAVVGTCPHSLGKNTRQGAHPC